MATAQSLRAFTGAALLSRGFRPFFLGAGLFALAAIAIWPAVFAGDLALPTALSAIDWHAHEMLFGYGGAVVAGFLLTAIPNWTGRLPVAGAALGSLALLWLAGRVAVLVSGVIGWPAAALIDAGFFAVFSGVIVREIVAGKNWRNLKMAVVVALIALADLGFFVEAQVLGTAAFSARAALALIVVLILLVGGRVIPSFTGNWLAKQGDTRRPAPFDRRDGIILVVSALALALWVALPDTRAVGAALLLAGAGNLYRLARWRGWRTTSDALVLILHVAFSLTALGFLAAAAHALWPEHVPAALGIHVWAIGGIGAMTLAMMTRATLGHTGRALSASLGTKAVYLLVVAAMAARIAMALLPGWSMPLMTAAAILWCLGFAGFVAIYGPMLLTRR